MLTPSELSLNASVGLFLAAAVVVGVGGIWLARLADRLADITGLGEAITGAVILGAVTSLSGSVTSIAAANAGHPELAVSNGVGGIAVQTVFLVLADLAYRRANLEHAAASLVNIFNGCLLVVLLSVTLIASYLPDWTVFSVHPATFALFVIYLLGLRMARQIQSAPMWGPTLTPQTEIDTPDEPVRGRGSVARMVLAVLALGVVVSFSGYLVAGSGIVLSRELALSEGLVGAVFTAVATSTPELVTTIAAVRRGALTLAVGGILGGNTFDVLFTAFADIGYRQGSIYHSMGEEQRFLIILAIAMTGTLLLGLLRRERYGPVNIGHESVALLGLYVVGIAVLAVGLPG